MVDEFFCIVLGNGLIFEGGVEDSERVCERIGGELF